MACRAAISFLLASRSRLGQLDHSCYLLARFFTLRAGLQGLLFGFGAGGFLLRNRDLLLPIRNGHAFVALYRRHLHLLLFHDLRRLHGLFLLCAGDFNGLLTPDFLRLHLLFFLDFGEFHLPLLRNQGFLRFAVTVGAHFGDFRRLLRFGFSLLPLQSQNLLARFHVFEFAGVFRLPLQAVALHSGGGGNLGDFALALRVEHVVIAEFRRVCLVQLGNGHGFQQQAVGFQVGLDVFLHLFGKLIALGVYLEQVHLRGNGAQSRHQLFADKRFDGFRRVDAVFAQ